MEISEIFGCRVFGDAAMRASLPEKIYMSLKATAQLGKPLDPEIADAVATAMKSWAIAQGATHYTHWFQPLNNITAGKYDSFLSLSNDGKIVTDFSRSALVQGEPDASSFPSGGLRATFEARGYTAWDPTSYAFVRDDTLYIPTAFCSYTGEALDTKTPLLRSMQALSSQALRMLRALGNTTSKFVLPTVGAEQEYFLIDRQTYENRLDLKLCGRTLMGARPPKGQEMDDHYCGRIRLRVAEFMRDLDRQLWELGIPSKTKHNEVAPTQHELAPIYETVNIATDHNQLTMELMRVTAKRHGLACLLHEKPFDGVNGSGKHNNFSFSTDDGINFLKPGKHPEENKLFLLTLCALIESVDTYADLIRFSAATPGNDARLGGNEAPPAIISVFLGEQLTNMLGSIVRGISPESRRLDLLNSDLGILPSLRKDDSDRNRTSPFALTGNKFEFRMLGSSQSVAFCNIVLNAAVADAFSRISDRLEACGDLEQEIAHIIADTMKKHSRILFNGNNYDPAWADEAKRRGLPILHTCLDASRAIIDPKNIALFERYHVLTESECHARYEIVLENLVKVRVIEADTMLHMARRQILPAAIDYCGQVAGAVTRMKEAGCRITSAQRHLEALDDSIAVVTEACDMLESAMSASPEGLEAHANHIQNAVFPAMTRLRAACDGLEVIFDADRWPMPSYIDLMYRV